MKVALISLLSILALTASAAATSINYTTKTHTYSRWEDQMESIVMEEEKLLREYLEKALECRLVELKFNNFKLPRFFQKGEYSLTLTADCNKTFSDFIMDITYGNSLGEPIALNISYNRNGKHFKKVIDSKLSDD